jgi:hypothetical protein
MTKFNKLTVQDMSVALRNFWNLQANPPWVDQSINRVRETAVIESGTVTTVTTVTGVTNVDGFQGKTLIYDMSNAAWAQCVRTRIT